MKGAFDLLATLLGRGLSIHDMAKGLGSLLLCLTEEVESITGKTLHLTDSIQIGPLLLSGVHGQKDVAEHLFGLYKVDLPSLSRDLNLKVLLLLL